MKSGDRDHWKFRCESNRKHSALVSGRRRLRQNWEFYCRSQRMPLTLSSPTLRRLRRNQRSSRSEFSALCQKDGCLWRWRMACHTLPFKVKHRAGSDLADERIIAGHRSGSTGRKCFSRRWLELATVHHSPFYMFKEEQQETLQTPKSNLAQMVNRGSLQFDSQAEGGKSDCSCFRCFSHNVRATA